MNNFFTKYFLKKGFLLFCPKTHNFGGFHSSLLWALKIKKNKRLKIIINLPLFSLHKHYIKNHNKTYGKKIIFNYFKFLSPQEKTLSLIMTIFGNILIFFCKFKILGLFNLLTGNKANKLSFPFLGFGLREISEIDNYTIQEKNEFWKTEVNLLDNSTKNLQEKKIISFCVKDSNYSKYKDISLEATADINNYKESLNYLIKYGYKVCRVGDDTMQNFDFSDKFYEDNCKSKNHFELLHKKIYESDFYFGTGASHSFIPDLYNKKKVLTNNIDFVQNGISSSYNNVAVFKKIFCVKQKKILPLEEVFFNEKLFFNKVSDLLKNKEIILIENNSDEILNALKYFLKNNDNKKNLSKLMMQYEDLRKDAITYYKKKNIRNFLMSCYETSQITILDEYLQNFLFNSKKLDEISKNFVKSLDL